MADKTPPKNKPKARYKSFLLIQFIVLIRHCFVSAGIRGRIAKVGSKAPKISSLPVTTAAAWMIRA
jgi:hypothetical protein